MENLYPFPRMGTSFLDILKTPFSRKILGHEAALEEDSLFFTTGFATRLDFLIRNPANHLSLFKLGYTSLEAFLQSNVTGPPLDFDPKDVVFPKIYNASAAELRKQMFSSLTVDGEAIYPLTPHIELFWLAKSILTHGDLCEGFNGRRSRMRVNFWHQKLLAESSDSLRDQIYEDAEVLEGQLTSRLTFRGAAAEYHYVQFLLEKAAIDLYYGNDINARTYLAKAAKVRGFEFALTGTLGKRTKYQDRDISQLVVLAKSAEEDIKEPSPKEGGGMHSPGPSHHGRITDPSSRDENCEEPITARSEGEKPPGPSVTATIKAPENVPLNDDTLLESIHFAPPKLLPEVISDSTDLTPALAQLDPSAQPLLYPFDSIILLHIASSITNTSPSDGLTREETLPYATRVLESGSSNWQVYTQALLLRSRIEGYHSRTAERGLLQLQALVDQVIVETTTTEQSSQAGTNGTSLEKLGIGSSTSTPEPGPIFFLPTARASESAPVAERLKYVYQLHPPLRWELEAELAARWVSMGGLKTALEIYERLQMYAEVALCLAATNNEAKAIRVARKLLFRPASGRVEDEQDFTGPELDVLPPDAPRLFCILGDLEDSPQHYQRAWTISNSRYPRAQRSLGSYYVRKKNYPLAAEAYTKSLQINRLNASTWFALGCVQLELEAFQGAVESFTRSVQLESEDAEAWSNLAAALLRLLEAEQEQEKATQAVSEMSPSEAVEDVDDAGNVTPAPATAHSHDPYKHCKDALQALRRAAKLKHNDARIWDNYLTVAASIPPPSTPWSEIVLAQKRLIALRGKAFGEKAVDEKILTVLVRYVTQEFEYPRKSKSRTQSEGGDAASVEKKTDDNVIDDDDNAAASREPFPRGSVPLLLTSLIDNDITPLITTSHALYLLLSDLDLWRHRPLAALEAREKAWRCVIGRPDVFEQEKGWDDVVDATVGLVQAYRELGREIRESERRGMKGEAERGGGMLVAKDWRFKARSAVRSVKGRGKGMWEGSAGWEKLEESEDGLSKGGEE